MDEELFGLCKEVNTRLGWGVPKTDKIMDYYFKDGINGWEIVEFPVFSSAGILNVMNKRGAAYPIYTSDYLLEKLPRNINEATNELLVSRWASRWRACYMPINLGHFPEQRTEADTPLKALLMLVIALDDAGQLVAAETTA